MSKFKVFQQMFHENRKSILKNISKFTQSTPVGVSCEIKMQTYSLKRLTDCSLTRTHNHLVHKRTPNHLAKLAKVEPQKLLVKLASELQDLYYNI